MALIDYAFDRETRGSIRMLRVTLLIGVFACMALFKSCSELKLSIWGRDATGTIARAEPSLYNRSDQFVLFNYVDEDGKTRHVERTITIARPLTPGEQVAVVYRKGREDDAVLAEERSMRWPMTLGGLAIAGSVAFIIAYRKSQAGEL
ncbi:MAG: hypothetical protein IT430_00500 [Phycisphaerales bacterium]|nr:hypothetical protein [Phycisphaerales bacterium]